MVGLKGTMIIPLHEKLMVWVGLSTVENDNTYDNSCRDWPIMAVGKICAHHNSF